MKDLFLVLLPILCTVIVARFVLKKYNSIFVFFASGVVILLMAGLLTGNSVLGDQTTGNLIVDIFTFIVNTFKKNISGVGTIIMTVTGYSAYMKHIKASEKLAFIATKPLRKIKNPYIVLSGVFFIGLLLKLVITSQAAVALLLLATTYPILMALGINKLTAASTICLVCLDWGPNDGSTIFAAETAGMSVVDFFINHQSIIGFTMIIILSLIIPIYYKYMDKKDTNRGVALEKGDDNIVDPDCPWYYALLPIIPLIIVFISSFSNIAIDVVAANFMGLLIVFVIEYIRRKDRKDVHKDVLVVLKAMGDIFVSVVAIIISASIFAEGIKQLGGISILANYISGFGSAGILIVIFMSLITFVAATIMGSGAASWFAFGPLAPDIAAKIGINQLGLIIPMELGAALGRGMSPVAGATIAISGYAGMDVMQVVKRTAPLLILGFVINTVMSIVLFVL